MKSGQSVVASHIELQVHAWSNGTSYVHSCCEPTELNLQPAVTFIDQICKIC